MKIDRDTIGLVIVGGLLTALAAGLSDKKQGIEMDKKIDAKLKDRKLVETVYVENQN